LTKPPKAKRRIVVSDIAEQKRLDEAREEKTPWKKWGPYLSERQWGIVREDYGESCDGKASAFDRGDSKGKARS
jgi:hypothetical protein